MYFAVISKKSIKLISAIIICAVILFTAGGGTYYAFSKKSAKLLPIYRVDRSDKVISISFDCAWGVDYTDKLLEIMEKEEVRCTFFTVEFWAKKHPDYLKKIDQKGHEIGTHSATHPYMSKLNKSAIVKELTTSINAISLVTGKAVKVFRAPYGDYNDLLLNTATELGLYTIQWDVDSLDWKDISANEIEKRVLNKVKNGSIILFHNQGLHTASAIEKLIPKLKELGYSFLPIGELIYLDNYKILSDGTQTQAI